MCMALANPTYTCAVQCVLAVLHLCVGPARQLCCACFLWVHAYRYVCVCGARARVCVLAVLHLCVGPARQFCCACVLCVHAYRYIGIYMCIGICIYMCVLTSWCH